MMKKIYLAAWLLFCIQSSSQEVAAGSFAISKTSVTLNTDGSVETIRLRNRDDDLAATVQIVALPWGTKLGEAEPVKEILAMPAIFELPASEEQIIRLATRNLDAEIAEQAYVLVITELPNEVREDDSNISFTLNMRLPLFAKPSIAEPEPIWDLRSLEDGTSSLTLENVGNAHISVEHVKVLDHADQNQILPGEQSGFVLAGDTKSWPLNADLGAIKGPVVIKADSNIGPIETVITLPEG